MARPNKRFCPDKAMSSLEVIGVISIKFLYNKYNYQVIISHLEIALIGCYFDYWMPRGVNKVSLTLKVNEKLGLALTLRQCPHCGHDRSGFASLAVLVSPCSATNVACANPNFSFTFKASAYCRRCWFSTLPTLTLTSIESSFEYWMFAPYSPNPNHN